MGIEKLTLTSDPKGVWHIYYNQSNQNRVCSDDLGEIFMKQCVKKYR